MKRVIIFSLSLLMFLFMTGISEAAYFFAGKKHILRTTPKQSFKRPSPGSYGSGTPAVSFNSGSVGGGGGGGSAGGSDSGAGGGGGASETEEAIVLAQNGEPQPEETETGGTIPVNLGGMIGSNDDYEWEPDDTGNSTEDDDEWIPVTLGGMIGSNDPDDWYDPYDDQPGSTILSPDGNQVPEPATILLLASGIFGLGFRTKKKR